MSIRTTYKYACDLDKGTYEVSLRNSLFQADSQADAFQVSVTRNGADVDVSGMNAYGYLYVAANQTTIALAGTVSGNTAEVVLTSDCYAVPGYASLVIQLHDGDVRHAVLKVNLCIERTVSNRVLTGGDVLPTLADLLGQISAMEQATAEARESAAAADAAREGIQGDLAALTEEIGEKTDEAIQIATTKGNEAVQVATTKGNEAVQIATEQVETQNQAIAKIAADLLTKAPAIECEASGALVTVTDAAAQPAVQLVTHIAPVQEGEGDPSPDNVRPIRGWDKVTAHRTGKNLFGGDAFKDTLVNAGGVYDSDAKTTTISAHQIRSVILFDDFEPNTQYTIVFTGQNTNSNQNHANLMIMYTDGTYAYLGFPTKGEKGTTVFVSDSRKSLRFFAGVLAVSSSVFYTDECGIFEGALTEADFEAYHGETMTAALPETVYGGTLDWGTGVLTVDRAARLISGFTWKYIGTKYKVPVFETEAEGAITEMVCGKQIACSCYARTGETPNGIMPNYSIYNHNNFAATNNIIIRDDRYTSVDALLENVGSQIVCFGLENPYTIQLTPQQLEMLKGTNNVWFDCGDTSLVYVADTKQYIDGKFAELEAAILSQGANV